MTIKATIRAWDARVSPRYKLILLALAEDHLGDSNGQPIQADLRQLVWSTGYTEPTLLRLLDAMVRAGILASVTRDNDSLTIRDGYASLDYK